MLGKYSDQSMEEFHVARNQDHLTTASINLEVMGVCHLESLSSISSQAFNHYSPCQHHDCNLIGNPEQPKI